MNRVPVANELSFRVGLTGHSGHLYIEPLPPVEAHNPLRDLPDFVLPPAFPEETKESIKEYIEEKYLTPRLDPDEFSPEKVGRDWDFDWFSKAKIPVEPSLPRTSVFPKWELPFRRTQGQEQEKWEPQSVQVEISELMAGAEDSGALPRITGPAKDFVRGSIHNRPFHPGGLDGSQSLPRVVPNGALNGDWIREVLQGGPAEKIPPSFKEGLNLGDLKPYPSSWNVNKCQTSSKGGVTEKQAEEKQNTLSLQFDELFKRAWEDDLAEKAESDGVESKIEYNELEIQVEKAEVESDVPVELSELDQVLSVGSAIVDLEVDIKNKEVEKQVKESWATRESNNGIADRFHELVPDLALEFPFELDRFQKEAIYYLEHGESVFVAAHTSAGKTVVAEYAFALASKHCTRAVYTAPIKTISNQKYRDFSGKFDVGLLTGDISLRPEASCLIMTTEILRSMLYRGADIIRDIEWVIFDEVHYVNDAERGVVWEEVIIMLPKHINFVLLSATVPNTIEFADWIGRTKQKMIRVTGTSKRPVPLEHCLFYSGELYRICENEMFLTQGLKAAKDAYKRKNSNTARSGSSMHSGFAAGPGKANAQNRENSHRGKQKHSGSSTSGNFIGTGSGNSAYGNQNFGMRRPDASLWLQLVNKLSKQSLLPVIIFCFSKNRCDRSADSMTSIDLTSSQEKSEIRVFCDKAFSRLKGSDRNLPQILRVQGLLHRGIGVHHAGLLPIVKEVIEMLFCRGVIKILFSTETFAMGVNAPARTVVFDTLRKFDGKEYRQVIPGEYTQMAGRAGRRGLDKFGTVIIMCRDEILEENDLRHVIVGHPTKLESQFRLTYIMILHLLRVEELKVEDMLKRSFAEFHSQKKLPEKQQLLMVKLAQPTKTVECIKGEPSIEEYYEMYAEAEEYLNQITEGVMQTHTAQQFLVPGRVVVVKSQTTQDHLLGVVVKAPSAAMKKYLVLVLKPDLPPTMQSGAIIDKGSSNSGEGFFMLPKGKRGLDDEYYSSVTARKGSGVININLPYQGVAAGMSYEVREVESKEFLCICNCKIKIDQVRLLEDVSAAAYSKTVQQLSELKSSGSKYPPALDPLKDLKLKDVNLVEAYYKWNGLLQKMAVNKCHGCIKLDDHMKLVKEIFKHREEVNDLKYQMSDKALQQMPDFQGRMFLRKLGV
ncbi:DExH-box ATP-dependent RNA helicase DExH11 isoform X2 [Amaranthus tricolor]|uniref:DExH-box ATP-dependent RNA helicase DExH11 isoform X2 n=1 Tax=Amaranthus tricolor TaxID=29722 RepID=UPI00258EE0DC|nr:DExH-box ATP-dependent RNA helicase DExH11 isoform X2 [Amaranthus tricolor]